MAEKLKLGVIGMSEGNGHPYSWSAIFNGYNKQSMENCPFPAIPEYLSKKKFPEDSLSHLGEVTHIWTQEKDISHHIAEASYINNVVGEMTEMIGKVDAILLARDDAENHYQMALPFLKAGLPVFIDKPLALSVLEANNILASQKFENQIFTCSSLRYAPELQVTDMDRKILGTISHVEASVPKKWETYGVHLIEPIVSQLPERGPLKNVFPFKKNEVHIVLVEWENISGYFKVTGNIPSPLKLSYFGTKDYIEKHFTDSYTCFKNSLETFLNVINGVEKNILRIETREIIEIIEKGIR